MVGFHYPLAGIPPAVHSPGVTGTGLHQSAKVCVTLRDDAIEGRGDLRVVEQRLIVNQLGSRHGNFTARRVERPLHRFHLRLRGEVFPLRVIHFLLGYQSGLGFRHSGKPGVLEVIDIVLRL
jgi:hypothetical protein